MTVTEDDNRGPKILGVLWALTGLTTFIVAARMLIRGKLLKNFGPDDWLIAASMCMGLAYCGVTTANVIIGYGKHAVFLSQDNLETAILLNTVSFLFGILSFTLPKLAVSAMLNRILNPTLFHRIALWFLTGFAAVVSVICILVLFTMCDPPKALWKMHLVMEGAATCKDTWILIDYAIFTGALSACVDLYLAIYPTTILLSLHMSLRKRLALCAALGLGSIASAMAIIKCTQLKGLADKSDYTYGTADLVMWTNIESNVVIVASCIPTLQPILELILGKRSLGSYSNNSSRQKNSKYMNSTSYVHSRRSMVRKPEPTINDVESQESILRTDDDQHHNDAHPLGQIRRTDNVTVEYEARTNDPDGRPSW
ncbi:uncharacterized protein EURHEDRAFT_446911 [Aspergillus ruber CBS 135680]|uniref:Rhodopsin domain-containing protein n=1 Tax=Aspergillus ruber (strain CBS 135680) TaxID=1388766 RepID=A0A017SQQ8_ASPRC|nr:uncharacterized protein EURHEDRAFT_446911 [Aspergillus ruber CBS 135680]EYE99323.1 hypothetical protein EURHEDRAFT_446911 [Aspergillus ruber CBS 135680]